MIYGYILYYCVYDFAISDFDFFYIFVRGFRLCEIFWLRFLINDLSENVKVIFFAI